MNLKTDLVEEKFEIIKFFEITHKIHPKQNNQVQFISIRGSLYSIIATFCEDMTDHLLDLN